jgi:2-keto-3-deoxy-L-rhamnonate aldolase RhmA
MANYKGNDKLAWMSLKLDDNRLPSGVQEALAAYFDAREAVEDAVKTEKPAPKGRRWVFTYKHGVGIALADAGNSNSNTDYFSN